MQPWKTEKQKVINLHKQIKESVINLRYIEKMFDGLYRKNIDGLKSSFENILDVLPMIQSFHLRSFNKRYTTRLLVSCFNQVIVWSVNYLTNDNSIIFWTQPEQLMIEKLTKCIELKSHIVHCYNKMMNKSISDGLYPFQILLNSAFENFVVFIDRLQKVSH